MGKRCRLFMISGAFNYGAPGRIVEQIGRLAELNNFEVLVAHSSRNLAASELRHFSVTSKLAEIVHALGSKLFDKHGLLSSRQTKDLISRIQSFKPKENGMIFKDQDMVDLTEKVLYLINNPNERERMVRNAYNTMRDIWSPRNAAQSLLKLIDILQGKQTGHIEFGPCSPAFPL